jgi:hypothetical protein
MRVRHLGMADDVPLGDRVRTPADPALVLDADRVQVPIRVARVPGHVANRDELHDLTGARDDEPSTCGFWACAASR